MRYTWYYGIFHWFIHYVIVIALVWSSSFHLINNFTVQIPLFGYVLQANVADYLLLGLFSSLVDLDHLTVYRKYGRRGIFAFATKRITYPVHNFFFLSLFAGISAFAGIFGLRTLSIILFTPVLHMAWDMFEDTFIFKTSYRKWEKTWGLKTKDLEKLWDDMQKKGSTEF